MDNFVEERVCLKFCVANEISFVESLQMLLKAFRGFVLSKAGVFFKNGKVIFPASIRIFLVFLSHIEIISIFREGSENLKETVSHITLKLLT